MRLLRRLEDWAHEQGASAIALTSGNHRHEAHEFYRRAGYQQTGVRFVKTLTRVESSDASR
jgi:GNAT superfamily N-acetyltransferase